MLTIDGSGNCRHSLYVIVMDVDISSLDEATRNELSRIDNLSSNRLVEGFRESQAPSTVTVLDPALLSSSDLEAWALEYAYAWTVVENIHVMAFLFGKEYVQRKLPYVRIHHCELCNRELTYL